MPKAAKNLYLDPEAVEHGERYARLHGTTLSRLVSDFLRALPLQRAPQDLSPTVRRLMGAGVPRDREASGADIEDYWQHLMNKYGQR